MQRIESLRTGNETAVETNSAWALRTVGVIWLAVVLTSIFAPDFVSGSEQQHFNIAAFTNWFWGLLATVYVLRATVFRQTHLDAAQVWISVAVSAIWVAVTGLSLFVPEVLTGTDPTRIPIAAILAPIVAVVLTKYVCEFLIEGFARREAGPTG